MGLYGMRVIVSAFCWSDQSAFSSSHKLVLNSMEVQVPLYGGWPDQTCDLRFPMSCPCYEDPPKLGPFKHSNSTLWCRLGENLGVQSDDALSPTFPILRLKFKHISHPRISTLDSLDVERHSSTGKP